MAESDGDIEFLDEDADIVQQCVQAAPVRVPHLVPRVEVKPNTLLVERFPAERKRKRRKDEEDSDYDPNDDFVPPSPPSPPSTKGKKKRQQVVKKVKTYHKETVPTLIKTGQTLKVVQNYKTNQNSSRNSKGQNLKNGTSRKTAYFPTKEFSLDRKKCSIRIPDYDDPLCLPVKAIQYEESDIKRMNNWNSVCLEHFKNCDRILKPERGETYSSTRTVVFRNVPNKQSGKLETTIWSKTCVENEVGDKKSEIFQCVLPRYKEKKVLATYNLISRKPKPYHLTDEVILSKESGPDGEVLIAYKPKESTSAAYKLVAAHDRKNAEEKEDDKDDDEDGFVNMYMKELAYLKMCAPCFQTSWRGIIKKSRKKKSIACPICQRSYVTVYNLLAHFKTHSSEDMQSYKNVISTTLAEIVSYHYTCRVCQEQFISIIKLREHVATKHQGKEEFMCEVCSHMVK